MPSKKKPVYKKAPGPEKEQGPEYTTPTGHAARTPNLIATHHGLIRLWISQGKRIDEIKATLNLSDDQLNPHLKKLSEEFRVAAGDVDTQRALVAKRLDEVYSLSVQAFLSSQGEVKKRSVQVGLVRDRFGGVVLGSDGEPIKDTSVTETTEIKAGDSGLLGAAVMSQRDLAKVLGLNKPPNMQEVIEREAKLIQRVLMAAKQVITDSEQRKLFITLIENGEPLETVAEPVQEEPKPKKRRRVPSE